MSWISTENISIGIRICLKFSVQYFSSQDKFPYHCPISDRGKFRCISISVCQLGAIWARCCLSWGGLCAMQRSDLHWVAMGVTPAIIWNCLAGAGWGLVMCWGFRCKRRDCGEKLFSMKSLFPCPRCKSVSVHISHLDMCLCSWVFLNVRDMFGALLWRESERGRLVE